MVRASSLFISAGLAAVSTAAAAGAQQTTVVSIMLPFGSDDQTIYASVVGASPAATTFAISCPPGTDSDECGLGTGVTLVSGPKTLSIDLKIDQVSENVACKLDEKSAVCTIVMADSEENKTMTQVETLSASDFSSGYVPLTVTAGAEKLSASAGAKPTASGPAPTGSAAAGSASTTFTTATATATASNSGSTGAAAQTQSSSVSTGGVPQITQNAVLMGAAALVGAMML